ncbi:flagellin [Azospirillum doebereinerae]|nr:flagellin [Azospirillum doebereinerae]MCG5243501.1 hypothetical protein [Azospirillum doebereinerae]
MASIMTNASAMTALQTLRKVTTDLEGTQDRISTGLKVNVAKDNAAYWSISSTMKSDVAGFKAVSDALGLGTSTAVNASNGADSVKNMLTAMKQRIVAAQSNGTDPKFLQAEVDQYIQQIEGVVASASFNGDNWLNVNYSPDGSAKDLNVDVLATLSRSESGVTPSYISFTRQDMRSDSILGQATIEQKIDSTVAAKASQVFDIGTSSGVYIDGQNLGLDKLTFKFTSEALTVNYQQKKVVGAGTSVNGDIVALTLKPITTDVTVDLSTIKYTTDQATTEALITKAINDAIVKQTYASMLPSVIDQSKTLAAASQRQALVDSAYDVAYTKHLAQTGKATDFEGAKAYGEATKLAIGAAYDRGDTAYNAKLTDGTTDLFTAALDLSGAAAALTLGLGSAASTAAVTAATSAPGLLGAAAPTDFATADAMLKDRTVKSAFATIDGKRQLQFTVGAGYKSATASADMTAAGNKVVDTNYNSKIEGLWVQTKESDAFGGLAELKQLDVQNNATRSLEAIDSMLTKVIVKAAAVGSIENRIGIQTDFLSKLTDAVNKGIGLLIDADMNEESSRLQALQVQQQLATQALSIANQGPQNILSLFR